MEIYGQLRELQKKYKEIEDANRSLNEQVFQLNTLYEVTQVLSTTLDLGQVLISIFNVLKGRVEVEGCTLLLSEHLVSEFSLGPFCGFSHVGPSPALLPPEEIIQRGWHSKEEFRAWGDLGGVRYEILLCPLGTQRYGTLGLLCFFHSQGFDKIRQRFLSRLADQIGRILEQAVSFQRIREFSFKDDLTGVYNRRYFNQQLRVEIQRAARYQRVLSLLILDIDDFKAINDTYGHLKGDQVLIRMSQVIRSNIRAADILARFGGEEFVVILPELDKPRGVIVAEKLRRLIEREVYVPIRTRLPVTVSVGVSSFPADGQTPEEILEVADQCMYEAKRQGKNRVHPPLAAFRERSLDLFETRK